MKSVDKKNREKLSNESRRISSLMIGNFVTFTSFHETFKIKAFLIIVSLKAIVKILLSLLKQL